MCAAQLKVACLGLGTMGNAIAKNILKKGFQLTVWNRTVSKANDLINAGASLASTPRETVTNADVIISCLYDDKSCLTMAEEENGYLRGMKKDAVHLNTTTITPNAAIQLEKLHQKYNTHYIAAPITGRPEVAAAGQLSSFLGGNRQAIERVRPVIESYSGGSILIVSENPAQANVVKLTGNMIILSNISLFGQIYALNERWNVDPKITRQIIQMFYSHPALLGYEERIRNRNYEKPLEGGYGVEGGLKDINAMLNTANEVNISLPFCNTIKEQYLSTIHHGLKDKDWSALGDATRIAAGFLNNKNS